MKRSARADASDEQGGAGFWIGAVLGVGIMVFGLKGLLDAAPATRPSQVAFGLLGLDVLHDAVVAPLACGVGLVLTRSLPRHLRAPIRAGLFASGLAILVGWAALRGYGRDQVPDNPTVDPLNYGTAVLTVLAIIWAGVALWCGIAWYRSGRATRVCPGQPHRARGGGSRIGPLGRLSAARRREGHAAARSEPRRPAIDAPALGRATDRVR